jgi:hypothetical protein
MKPLYIFDLDGTLALIGHRQALLADKRNKQRWRQFFALCDRDIPNIPVIATMERLRLAGADIRIFSGRSDEVRHKTVAWLACHTSFFIHELESQSVLKMREQRNYTPDDLLKESWLLAMLPDDRHRLVAVFDDRDRVVAMWRKHGVTCFQVAPGAF